MENEKAVKPDEIVDESETDDEDPEIIFDILHEAIDGMKNKYNFFMDNPTMQNYNEFNELTSNLISLVRDLKNLSKSLLPKTEKPKKEKQVEKPVEEPQSEQPQPPQAEKKKRGRKPKQQDTSLNVKTN